MYHQIFVTIVTEVQIIDLCSKNLILTYVATYVHIKQTIWISSKHEVRVRNLILSNHSDVDLYKCQYQSYNVILEYILVLSFC